MRFKKSSSENIGYTNILLLSRMWLREPYSNSWSSDLITCQNMLFEIFHKIDIH